MTKNKLKQKFNNKNKKNKNNSSKVDSKKILKLINKGQYFEKKYLISFIIFYIHCLIANLL